jgi:hypothetical protein
MKLTRIAAAAAVAALLLWSAVQTVGALRAGNGSGGDAVRLLYQVSELHMELLASQLQTAGAAKSAAELEPLKQALYTATFTHDRFVQAVGESNLPQLRSLTELSQLMLRLQLGGTRAIKPQEAKLLQEAAAAFARMVDSYSKLLSSGDSIVSSQSRSLREADDKLEELLQSQAMK